MGFDYSDAAFPIRDDIPDAHRQAWSEIASPVNELIAAVQPGAGSTRISTSSDWYRSPPPACESYRSIRFDPLPSAAAEVEEIESLWRQAPDQMNQPKTGVIRLSGAAANEAAFKRLAPGRRVIVICPAESSPEATQPRARACPMFPPPRMARAGESTVASVFAVALV